MIDNGQFRLTSQQLDVIRQEFRGQNVVNAENEMVLSFITPEDITLQVIDKPVGEIEHEAENLVVINSEIEKTTEPYTLLFKSMVPPIAQNKRGLFGKLKDHSVSISNRIDMTDNDRKVTYIVNADYLPGEEANTLQSATVKIAPTELLEVPNDHELVHGYPVELNLVFSQERMVNVGLYFNWVQGNNHYWMHKFYAGLINPLSLPSSFPLRFHLGSDKPSVIFGANELTYAYDPANINYKLKAEDADRHWASPQIITTNSFISLLQSALDFVPTKRSEI